MKQFSLHDFYRIYSVHFLKNGEPHRILLGTFAVCDNDLHIFSDYHGWIEKHIGHGKITPEMKKRISSVQRSQYLDLVSEHQIENGYRPDLVQDIDTSSMNGETTPEPEVNIDDKTKARRPPIWDLFIVGEEQPSRLEVKDKKLYFDGKPCTDDEHDYIMNLLNTGGATLRYPRAEKDPMKLGKYEQMFRNLAKADPVLPREGDEAYSFDNLFRSPQEAASAAEFQRFDNEHWPEIQAAWHNGVISDDAYNGMRSRAYEDTMTRGIGNKASYYAFLNDLSKTRKRGTHIMIDGNDFKHINDSLGHDYGDEAIRMYGKALRNAIDNGVGKESVKAHRFGGDEFCLWVENPEGESPEAHNAKVAQVVRDFRTNLEAMTPSEKFPELNTTHKLSFSAGSGKSPAMAETALKVAKAHKNASGKRPGEQETHYHALTPE